VQKFTLKPPIKEKLSLKSRMGLIFPHSATTSVPSLEHDVVGEGNSKHNKNNTFSKATVTCSDVRAQKEVDSEER
jgi:hypothetical protein